MKLTEYLKKEVPKLEDLLLLDGADGTNVITFENLAKALKTLNEIKSSDQLYDWLDEIITPVPDLRKNIYRGKNLGTILTKEQAKNIVNGSFKGFFLGDYWMGTRRDDRNLSNPTESLEIGYRIYDFDYWYWKGMYNGGTTTAHHLTIMPNGYMWIQTNLPVQNTNGGYLGLSIHNDLHKNIPGILSSLFKEGDILSRQAHLTNVASSGVATSAIRVDNVKFVLPSVAMLIGTSQNVFDDGTDTLLSLPNLARYFVFRDQGYNTTLCRNIWSSTTLVAISGTGLEILGGAISNTVALFRPVFGITGAATAS